MDPYAEWPFQHRRVAVSRATESTASFIRPSVGVDQFGQMPGLLAVVPVASIVLIC